MCGLYGFVRHGSPVRTLPALLGVFNDDRGGESWGYYAKTRKGTGVIRKGIGLAAAMPSDAANTQANASVLIGHTRRATTGKVVKSNSHPWNHEGYILAHNGMVTNHSFLNKLHGRQCEVDSMHLLRHVAEGLDLAEIEAYGAITFVCPDDPDAVYMGTFNGGELDVRSVPGFGLVWSSDEDHLGNALTHSGMKPSMSYDIRAGVLYRATAHKLTVFGQLPISPCKWGMADYGYTSGGKSSRYAGSRFAGGWGEYEDDDGATTVPAAKSTRFAQMTDAQWRAWEEGTLDDDDADDLLSLDGGELSPEMAELLDRRIRADI